MSIFVCERVPQDTLHYRNEEGRGQLEDGTILERDTEDIMYRT